MIKKKHSRLRRIAGSPIFWTVVGIVAAAAGLFVIGPGRFHPRAPERIGHAPLPMIAADWRDENRLFSGTFVSTDGGRSWKELADRGGRRIVLLGGPHAIRQVVSQNGKVLFGEVLFDEPPKPLGLGKIAHAVEWDKGEWRVVQGEIYPDAFQPSMRVAAVRYQAASERPIVIMEREIIGGDDMETPGKTIAGAVTNLNAAYVAVREAGKFPLYKVTSAQSWAPVPGARNIVDVDASPEGVVYAAGETFGREVAQSWRWTPWPQHFVAEHIRVHPQKSEWVAAWGGGRLVVTPDGGTSFRHINLPGTTIIDVAWTPSAGNVLLALDANRNIHRVRL